VVSALGMSVCVCVCGDVCVRGCVCVDIVEWQCVAIVAGDEDGGDDEGVWWGPDLVIWLTDLPPIFEDKGQIAVNSAGQKVTKSLNGVMLCGVLEVWERISRSLAGSAFTEQKRHESANQSISPFRSRHPKNNRKSPQRQAASKSTARKLTCRYPIGAKTLRG